MAPFAGLLAILCWVPATTVVAQTPVSAEAGAESATPEEVHPIPLEAVPDRAQAVRSEIAALITRGAARKQIDEIDLELDHTLQEVAARLESAHSALSGRVNIRTLQERAVELSDLQAQLRPWNEHLDARLGDISAAIERLDAIEATWAKTAESMDPDGKAGPTAARIAAVRLEVSKTRVLGIEQRARLLAARLRLVDPSTALTSTLDQLESATGLRLENVLRNRQQPVWSSGMRDSLRDEWPRVGPQLIDRLYESQRYVSQQSHILVFQLLLFAVLVWGLLSLRDRARARAEDDYDLRRAQVVFEHPWAMAAVLVTLFTSGIHPLAPRSGAFVAIGIIALAALRLGRPFMPPTMAPLAWGFVAFFLIDRFRDLLDSTPTIEHLIFLIEMLGALALLMWLRDPSRVIEIPKRLRHAKFIQVLGAAMRVSVVILAFAIAADLAGWGDLATLLGSGVLRGGYLGFFLFVLFMVLQGLVAFSFVLWPLRLLRSISQHRMLVRRRVDWLLGLATGVAFATILSAQLGVFRPAMLAIGRALDAGLSLGALSVSVADLIAFALTVWLSFQLARLIDFFLKEDVFPRIKTGRGVPYAISGLLRYTLIFLGLLAGLAAAGLELTKLTVIAGGLGVGIGFGLQNVVNNFVSGLILLFERPIQVGDTIALPDAWGAVIRIGIRASVIRTFDGAEVIVPNGMLISEKVTNWTLSDKRRRVDVNVGVQYGTPAQKVIDLLVEVAHENSNVIDDPEPRAFFIGFGDSSLDFKLRAWIEGFDDGYSTRSDLSVAVQQALADAGISVPFPQRDLHLIGATNPTSVPGTDVP